MHEISDYKTLTAIVLDRIRDMILNLELRPGQRISQDDLSSELGVSRMPVRQALRVLEFEGLVKNIPHRGVVVTEVSVQDVKELGIIRCALEGAAAELAPAHMDKAKIDELRNLLEEMEKLGIPPVDEARYLSAHRGFHLGLYNAAGLTRLSKMAASLWEANERCRRVCASMYERQKEAEAEHRAIFEACVDGDGKRARLLLEGHLNRTTAITIEFLSKQMTSVGGVSHGDAISE